jgi:hypothetical protein
MIDIDDVRRETRKLLEPLQQSISANAEAIASLGQTVAASPGAFAEIVNIIDNSHPEWSDMAYTLLSIASNTAGDANMECYNFHRQPAVDTILSGSNTDAVKCAKTSEPADHSLWAANEAVNADIPRWDKVNGTLEFGQTAELWDLYVPFPNDVVFPGQIFYVQFEAMLADATPLTDIQAFCGLFDSTVGQQKFIEGGSFTITDDQGNDPGVTYGIPGSTSVNYKIIAYTDSGEQAESNVLNFPNAPAVFDGNNHPRIKFSGVPGFIKFEIYREIAGTYVLQYVVGNTIEGIYYDLGLPAVREVDAFPTITVTKPRAYAVTSTFTPGTPTGLAWVRHAMTILVPTTYNKALTDAGKQFFRFGLTGFTATARQVLIRKFGVSMGSGKWARSPNDVRKNAHSAPSTSAAGAGAGDGGGGIDPPPPGGGGGCVLLDSTIALYADDGSKRTAELHTIGKDAMTDNGGAICGKVKYVKQAHTSRIFRVVAKSGLTVGATFDHPFITSPVDHKGTACIELQRRLNAGQEVYILTRPKGEVISDRIISITEEFGDFWVGIPSIEGSPVVILNGFLSHNNKPVGGL